MTPFVNTTGIKIVPALVGYTQKLNNMSDTIRATIEKIIYNLRFEAEQTAYKAGLDRTTYYSTSIGKTVDAILSIIRERDRQIIGEDEREDLELSIFNPIGGINHINHTRNELRVQQRARAEESLYSFISGKGFDDDDITEEDS